MPTNNGREHESNTTTTTQSCRLCGATVTPQFRLTVLNKHDVGFFRCTRCESLQSEPPFWLDEAYSDQRRFFDTGAVTRNQALLVQLWYITKLFGFRAGVSALDWGGGDGLFTRMMRDIGIDAYHSDKFAINTYAAGFEDSPDKSYKIITAFEVWEHLPDPATVIEQIFSRKPAIHFLTTGIYKGQDAKWGYIWPTTGRHVFFFSSKAMQLIAEKYGYSVIVARERILFFNCPLSPFRRRLLTRVLSGKNSRLLKMIFTLFNKPGLEGSDRALMQKLRGC